MTLNATILGREGLRLLRNEIRSSTDQGFIKPGFFKMTEPRPGIFYENVGLEVGTLEDDFESVALRFIWPAMRRLAKRVSDIPLGNEYMELPKGVDDAANDRFDGIAMRTIISKRWPWHGEPGVWHRDIEYYDIETDAMKTGPCGIGLVFTVHKPGAELYIPGVSFDPAGPVSSSN